MEQVLIDLAAEDPTGLYLFERKCNTQLGIMERVLYAAKSGVDLIDWRGLRITKQSYYQLGICIVNSCDHCIKNSLIWPRVTIYQ